MKSTFRKFIVAIILLWPVASLSLLVKVNELPGEEICRRLVVVTSIVGGVIVFLAILGKISEFFGEGINKK